MNPIPNSLGFLSIKYFSFLKISRYQDIIFLFNRVEWYHNNLYIQFSVGCRISLSQNLPLCTKCALLRVPHYGRL